MSTTQPLFDVRPRLALNCSCGLITKAEINPTLYRTMTALAKEPPR